jgi:hypothetical protein
MLALMPAGAAMAWACAPDRTVSSDVLVAVLLALPVSAGFLAPLAVPSLGVGEAVAAGLYALAAMVCCGSLALWLEVAAYAASPPRATMVTACLAALAVYAGMSRWAFADRARFGWAWGAAAAAGIAVWAAVLLVL